LAQRISPETLQLYYQIALLGRRDISLAPDEFAGFTMSLLRMLAFTPSESEVKNTPDQTPIITNGSTPVADAMPAMSSQPIAQNTEQTSFTNSAPPIHDQQVSMPAIQPALVPSDEDSAELI